MLIPLMLPIPSFPYTNPSTAAIYIPTQAERPAQHRAVPPLDVFIIGDRDVHGSAPRSDDTGDDILACTAILSPDKPLRVGMTVRLVPVRRSRFPTSPVRPARIAYKAYRPVVGGNISSILSHERHTITFVVQNTLVLPSRFALAHLAISFNHGTTVRLGLLSRISRALRIRSLPDSRIVPIDRTRYPSIDFTDLDNNSPPDDSFDDDGLATLEGSFRASPTPTDPGPYPIDVSGGSEDNLLEDATQAYL